MPAKYLTENDYPEDVWRIRATLIRQMGRAERWIDIMEIHEALEHINRKAKAMVRESQYLEPERWHQVVCEASGCAEAPDAGEGVGRG